MRQFLSATLFFALATSLAAQEAELAIVGGMLIDGHGGPPLHGATVLVEGNRIVAVGRSGEIERPAGAEVLDASGMTVMPGLIDVHVHLDLLGHADYRYWHGTYSPRYREIMVASARQLVMHGVTTVADLIGEPRTLQTIQRLIETREIPGPRVVASMSWICNWSEAYLESHHRKSYVFNVRTVEEARAAAREMIEMGAGIIKVHTGLTEDQMRAIAEEAAPKGIKITGHVGDREDLLMRIRSGQNGIEHLYMGASGDVASVHPDVVQALLDEGTYVIPTMIQTMMQERGLRWPGMLDNPRARAMTPPDLWDDIRRSIAHPDRLPYFGGGVRSFRMDHVGKKIRRLWDAGVRVLVGTDSGTVMNFHTDATWQEMDLLVEYGIDPMEAIVTATRHNADYLGLGGELGTVTPGKLADLLVVDGNPLLSMRDLRHVAYVVKDGEVLKRPR